MAVGVWTVNFDYVGFHKFNPSRLTHVSFNKVNVCYIDRREEDLSVIGDLQLSEENQNLPSLTRPDQRNITHNNKSSLRLGLPGLPADPWPSN